MWSILLYRVVAKKETAELEYLGARGCSLNDGFLLPLFLLNVCLYATLNPSSSPSPIFLKLRTWIETSVCLG